MGDNPRQLGGHGDQECLFALIEAAPVCLLHHQHPQHIALVDDRYTEEGVITLFADVGQELETGVVLGVLQVDRLLPLGHQPYQALSGGQAGDAYLLLVQPLSGAEYVAPGIGVTHIDAANLGAHGVAHPAHDNTQGIVEALGGVDLLDDMAEGLKHSPGAPPTSRYVFPEAGPALSWPGGTLPA